jgi:hypothetical protein
MLLFILHKLCSHSVPRTESFEPFVIPVGKMNRSVINEQLTGDVVDLEWKKKQSQDIIEILNSSIS